MNPLSVSHSRSPGEIAISIVGEVLEVTRPEVTILVQNKTVILHHFSQALTALSVTLGPRVFNVIVGTAAAATRLVKAVNRRGLPGELQLLPLDRLWDRNRDRQAPKDTIPLLNLVNYPPDLEVAIR